MDSRPGIGGADRRRTPEQLRARYEWWSEHGRGLSFSGRFRHALRAHRVARSYARRGLDAADVDQASLNLAFVHVNMGHPEIAEEGLREILLRSSNDRLAFNAAYALSACLRRQGRHEKALTYARRALDRSRSLDSPNAEASSHLLLGNIYLSQSYLDDARRHYEMSLELRTEPADRDEWCSRATVLETSGYCLILAKDIPAGVERIREAQAISEQWGFSRTLAECMQDRCYAELLTGNYEEALARGTEALDLASEHAYEDIVENCHYLLGEIGNKTDDPTLRDRHFESLQELHPELPFLKDFLCSVDVTSIITLKR